MVRYGSYHVLMKNKWMNRKERKKYVVWTCNNRLYIITNVNLHAVLGQHFLSL